MKNYINHNTELLFVRFNKISLTKKEIAQLLGISISTLKCKIFANKDLPEYYEIRR